MARKSNLQPLALADSNFDRDQQRDPEPEHHNNPTSPLSPKSPRSPRSPFNKFSNKKQGESSMQGAESQYPRLAGDLPQSQTLPAINQYSAPTAEESKERERPAKTGFFSTYKASKSSNRLQASDSTRPGTENSMSKDTERPALSGNVSSKESTKYGTDSDMDKSTTRRPVGSGPSKSHSTNTVAYPTEPSSSSSAAPMKKQKSKPSGFNLLGRTKSVRGDELSPGDPPPNNKLLEPEKAHSYSNSIKTAPLRSEGDRSFKDMMGGSSIRQHSADRQASNAKDIPAGKERDNKNQNAQPSSLKEGGGHTFLNNLKTSASKGAGAISKGLFGKSEKVRLAEEKERAIEDETYELKILCLPLVEQTRLTRISKRLEDSRDKTEFWMPALPWRAIDYLNYKGSEVEGLYRVPGSGPQVKKWQKRFDQEIDINLFEQELYDINTIGSMLKAWLRELPDEMLDRDLQKRIERKYKDIELAAPPPELIDALSDLPPFHYYLLFAITCHLSLLLAHTEKNKMDYRNLCICFQPCTKIDSFCFRFLVCNWRDCWKGCKNESEFVRAEYEYFSQESIRKQFPELYIEEPTTSAEGRSSTAAESHDEHTVSSSNSSDPPSLNNVNDGQKSAYDQVQFQSQGQSYGQAQYTPNKKFPLGQNHGNSSTVSSTTLSVLHPERTPPRKSSEMRPLSPIAPLSPIGL